ncbi:MAG TPA: glycosyltransferase [Candidatus Dormibacteraeota bacterium]|nr:glycosyltransferase [Candidatus Dormibacteraeota bacterium]
MRLILLLGKPDTPADGVLDYCEYLAEALRRREIETEIARVDWNSEGWIRALQKIRAQAVKWNGAWIILQYTALSWSRRGFPLGALAILRSLRRQKLHCAVVFHESRQQGGVGLVGLVRGAFQDWVIRRIYSEADIAIFADPLDRIEWLPTGNHAVFIPIGANLPAPEWATKIPDTQHSENHKVAIYCLSDPPNLQNELRDISTAIHVATAGRKVRVVFLGRGTTEARDEITRAFDGTSTEVSNFGMQDATAVRDILMSSDAMLCVRGEMYPTRGSAVAGIACGLPIVGYGTSQKAFPISQAGVRLVPYRDSEALGTNLAQILSDGHLREQLIKASRLAQEKFFSWHTIADQMIQAFSSSRE